MDKKKYIEEEVFVVENSGEIPEVTYHESLHHLTEDPDGPSLILDTKEILPLKQAVVKRYKTIILRDLDPHNRDKGIYRGLARCLANWQRFEKFCGRENMDFSAIRLETAEALQKFLEQEAAEVKAKKRSSSINCSSEEIESLAEALGFSMDDLPEGWQELCQNED